MQCRECAFFDAGFGECDNKQINDRIDAGYNNAIFKVTPDFYCKFWQLSSAHKNKLYDFAELFKEYEYPKFSLDFEVINGKLNLIALIGCAASVDVPGTCEAIAEDNRRQLLALNLLNIIKNKNEWIESVQVRTFHVSNQ